MDAQQSPDRDPSRINSKSDPVSAEFLADDIVKHDVVILKAPELLTVRDRNFAISVLVNPHDLTRVEWVNVKAFSKDGTPVADLYTSASIPESISREVLRLCKEHDRRQDPKATLKDIVSLFKERFPVEWSEMSPTPEPEDASEIPRFFSMVPTLEELASRPSIVDEHLVAVTSKDQELVRLTVRMNSTLGVMRCTIESESLPGQPREWKIKARLDSTLDIDFLRTDLMRKANELLIRLHVDGAQELIDSLDRGYFDAVALPKFHTVADQIDSRLARGLIDVPDRSAELEHSGAKVSLRVGIRCAVIEIAPCPEDPSQAGNIVFKCSEHYPELTAFQVHYIETAYILMTSSSAAERYRGARMCGLKKGIRPFPFEAPLPEQSAQPALDSIYQNEFEYWGSYTDLSTLLGEEAAEELNRIPNIRLVDPPPDSAEDIVNMLDGGRKIVAIRPESDSHERIHTGSVGSHA